MGQYFKVINVDKQQQIRPSDFNNMRKLMEFSYEGNEYVMALYKLLEKRWKGNRVYVTGDYDDEINDYHKGSCYYNTYKELEKELKTESLYHLSDQWKKLTQKSVGEILVNELYKRIYNTETKQFIDLTNLPVEWFYKGWIDIKKCKCYEPTIVSISPLPLLITFGNGAGGSFYCEDEYKINLVGSWCKYSKGIIVSKEILKEYEDSFTEFKPDFTENKKMITHEEGVKKLKQYQENLKLKFDNFKKLRKILESNNFQLNDTDNTSFITIMDNSTMYIEQLEFNNYSDLINVNCFITALDKIIKEYDLQSKFDSLYRNGIDSKQLMSNIERHKLNLEKLKKDLSEQEFNKVEILENK